MTSREPSRASRVNLLAFELASLLLWVVTAVLIATVYDNQRDYWFLLLSWTLVFPISAVADEYALILRYDAGLARLYRRLPVMIPFAFGWFFTLPLILIWRTGVIDRFPLQEKAVLVFAALLVWSFFVEWLGVTQKLWTYHWSHGRRWRKVPVVIPVIDAITYVAAFLLHEVAVRATADLAWPAAFATSYLIYAGAFAVIASLSWLLIRRVWRVLPTYA